MKNFSVFSINTSSEKGTIKYPQKEANITIKGIEGDAHSGTWHRQISLLSIESIRRFEQVLGRKIEPGEFAENITTEGINLLSCKPLDHIVGCHIELMVTQIGKECHGEGCEIFRQVGKCIMPNEGIFAKVLREGPIKVGDSLLHQPKIFHCLVITLSDRAFFGEYSDKSGPTVTNLLEKYFTENERSYKIQNTIIPDDAHQLKEIINQAIAEHFDLIITTGGTGIGPKDITVDTIKPMLEKEIPGIMEYIRYKYGSQKPQALFSRSIAGLIKKTLIFTLPGSVKAVNEYMNEIIPQFEHLFYMLYGIDKH